MIKYSFFFLCLILGSLQAQQDLLQSGPMLGYIEMREALVWVQTKEAAAVKIGYKELGGSGGELFTDSHTTLKHEAFTAKLIADQVQPGKTYQYTVYINDKPLRFDYPTRFTTQSIWRWQTDPPAFKVALGSCFFINDPVYDRPGKGYGGEYEIVSSIDKQNPDLMVWLGDNIYLREPDWYTRTGYFHRYTHTRSLAQLQPLLAKTPQYAIWDDHDYGPNNADRGWVHKELAAEAFNLFWGNPSSGLAGQPGNDRGISSMFRYNDVDFFLLDNRSFRSSERQKNPEGKTILGKAQLDWLIDNLIFSDATYKMVCVGSQVLNSFAGFENYANIAPEERQYLLDRINQEGIENVIFLTGDRHHTELSEVVLPNGKKVYDLTVSSLTSGTGNNRDEINENRVAGTMLVKRNFGLLEFSGPYKARKLLIRILDKDGQTAWVRTID